MADKSILVRHLEHQNDRWHGLSDLKAIAPEVPDRTLRNWLTQLTRQGVVERTGEKKGARYRWASSSPDTPSPATSTQSAVFTPPSRDLLKRVEAPLYTRPPVTYAEEWVASYVPNQSFYLSESQRLQLHRQGKRPGIQGRAGTYIQRIFNRLLIDLSYNSSRLEGNTYSFADTERLVLKGVSAEGKLKEERVMILNHKEAIRYLVENVATISPDEETIRTLHYLLAADLVAPGMAGQIRDESILVSGTTYAPLEGRERLSRLLVALLEKARHIENPFEQSFFLLGHISYLQAFVDVNKRTARLASIIPLISNDYVPQSFIDVDKDHYLKALICFYEFKEAAPLAELYCWSYLRACLHYDTSVQVVGFDEIAALYRTQRRALVAEIVRSMISTSAAAAYLEARVPSEVEGRHRSKFLGDVRADLEHLDVSRIAGLGISREQLEAWLRLNPK